MAGLLGRKIRELRLAKGMTLDELARATGSSKSYLWELEHRDAARPSGEKLVRIATALGVTPEYFVDDSRESPDEDVVDQAFYRKYRTMPQDTKRRLRQILDAWDDDG
jgi:transcriptional regulator with XRE-family HTH domain